MAGVQAPEAPSTTFAQTPNGSAGGADSGNIAWHSLPVPTVLERLGTDAGLGLSGEEAAQRLATFGPNTIQEAASTRWLSILIGQFTGVMVIILIAAAIISLFIGEVKDTAVILAIVVLNAALGFFQEYRAERAIAALKRLAVHRVRCRRDGRVQEVSADTLVSGDVVFLEAGSRVPADVRLVEVANLQVDEAPLTGESVPVEKTVESLDAELAPPDRRNMGFMGTTVTYGRAVAVVTATGMATQLGRIAQMLQSVESGPTPLQRRLDAVGRTLAVACLVIVAVVFVAGLLRGISLDLMILTAISLAVAAVPEGLPAVITIALALGAQRMVRRNALIRKLPAVETLGSVTVICSDKTGTLTQNQMTVSVLVTESRTMAVTGSGYEPVGQFIETKPEERLTASPYHRSTTPNPEAGTRVAMDPCTDDHLCELLRAGALCNDAHLNRDADGRWRVIGDPTEGALLVVATKAGIQPAELATSYPRINEIPFTSERKRMTTLHRAPDVDLVAYSKGAVDRLLEVCSWTLHHGEAVPLTPERIATIHHLNDSLADRGLRVLGLAYRRIGDSEQAEAEAEIEQDMVFLGLVGMIDPARPEVAAAVERCRTAGIRAVMITGDHPLTARAIGQALGMVNDRNGVVTGAQLERMETGRLAQVLDHASIFARVSPEHKLKIVDALQQRRQVVSMTGDGVNDAPALKRADIGVAMGITGTDVSKEAADMVLLDDNFATIVAAVEEGRVLYDNIRKFIRYLLSTNAGEVLTMFFAILIGMPLPLLPIQILWVNLVTDGLPAIALGFERAEPGVMKRQPRDPHESVFASGLGVKILSVGLLMAAGTLGLMSWALGEGRSEDAARTMAFTTLALFQLWHVLALRSETQLLPQIGVFSNRVMVPAVVMPVLLQLAIIYLPPLQGIFDTMPLTGTELALCFGVSSLGYFVVEIQKLLSRPSRSLDPAPATR